MFIIHPGLKVKIAYLRDEHTDNVIISCYFSERIFR